MEIGQLIPLDHQVDADGRLTGSPGHTEDSNPSPISGLKERLRPPPSRAKPRQTSTFGEALVRRFPTFSCQKLTV